MFYLPRIKFLLALLFIILFYGESSFAQMPAAIRVNSPASDNLKTEVLSASNYFNGSISVSLPVTSFKSDGIEIPISLSYNSNGIRPNTRPTWVGIGWNLKVGGEITRSVRGLPDEQKTLRITNDYRPAYYDINGHFFPMVSNKQVKVDYDGSYLHNRGLLNNYSGNTNTFVNSHVLPNFNNKEIDLAPDEFFFDCNGLTGSFYFSPDGGFKFKSRNGDSLKVEYEVKDDYAIMTGFGLQLPRAITSFKLTDKRGYQYFFGGDGAIEYDRPAKWTDGLGTCSPFQPQPTMFYYDAEVTINTWKLVKIVAPNKHTVTLKYSPKEQIVDNPLVRIYGKVGEPNAVSNGFDTDLTQKSMATICVLDEISDNKGNKLTFNKEVSTSLGSLTTENSLIGWVQSRTLMAWMGTGIQTFYSYNDRGDRNCAPPFRDQSFGPQYTKLTSITSTFENQAVETYLLGYRDEIDKRLRLTNITKKNSQNELIKIYDFQYNPMNLPGYTSKQDDHWGYYNGKNFFGFAVPAKLYTYTKIVDDFMATKEMDHQYAGAELLDTIRYGTGGYQKYVYEPNECSSIFNYSNFQVSPSFANQLAPGLRVKKIEEYDENNTKQSEKVYHYVKNYITNGSTSSGIQKGEKKLLSHYLSNISGVDVWGFGIGGIVKTSDLNGNIVTYSEVTEETKGFGLKTFYFKNSDNTALESAPDNINGWVLPEQQNFDALYSGLLYKEEHYDEQRSKTYERINNYRRDLSNHLISIAFLPGLQGVYSNSNNYTNTIYTYTPFLTGTIERTFNTNGEIITNEKTYTYDLKSHNLIAQTSTRSDGSIKRIEYDYADKFAFSGTYFTWVTNANGDQIKIPNFGTNVYSKMVNSNMIGLPIESKFYILKEGMPNKLTSSILYTYADNNPSSLILPEKELVWNFTNTPMIPTVGDYKGLEYDSEYQVLKSYYRYSNDGKPLSVSQRGLISSYLYSHKGLYPIAEIKSVDYLDLESVLGAPVITTFSNLPSPDKDAVDTFLLPLKTAFPNSHITSYTYKPLVGLTSQTDAKGMTTYYAYDSFNRLENIKDQNGDIVKNYRYNYADGSTPPVGTTYKNRELTIYKTKNNCGAGQQSVPIAHVVPANTYSSTESIDAADQVARTAEDAIAQAKANSLGVCTTPTPGTVSLSFSVPSQFSLKITNTATNIATDYIITGSNTITNIPSGTVNVTLTDDVPGGAIYSFNLNGEVKSGNSVTFSGASFAVNATLTVTRTSSGSHYNTAFDIAKTKTNCPSGTGTSVNYPVAANLYTSTISVADANDKARIGEDTRAQANANKLGGCTINGTTTYYSQLTLVTKAKNDCPNGVSGVPSEISYPAGAYTSTISVADADQQVHAAAQQNANSTGGCAVTSGTFSLNFVAPLSSHFSVHFKDVAGNTLRNLTIHGNHVINDLPGGTGSITIAPWPSPPDGLTFSYSVNGGTAQPTAPAQFTGVALSGTINVNVVQTRFANQVLTVAKTRNNCVNGEIGSSVNYIVPASTYWAASQTGADQLAQADANANAQNYANANGTCRDPFYSAELVVTKQKSCPVGQTGSSVAYTVPARKYTSTISQADADQKAQQDANNNAQNNANTLGACTVPTFTLNYSLPIHQQFTLILRNDYTNTPITYTISGSGTLVDIPGGSSYISIQPTTYMEGVDYTFNVGTYSPYSGTSYFTSGLPMLGTMQLNVTANQQIYYNVVATWKAVKACGYGFVGSEVTYTVPAGKYWSILGQSIADNQANEDSYTNAQAYANANGTCTPIYYSQALTIGKTRNNCAATYTGSLVYYYIQNGKYTSMISQADANQKAQADADANAQNYANTNGTCTPPVIYYSQPISVYKTKNNCPVGDVGGNVTYFVAPGKYTSLISQADADQQAQADFNANAQNYANANGTCTTPVFTLNYSVPDYAYFVVKLHNPTLGLTFYHTILGTGSLVNIRGGYGWDVEVYPDEAGNTSYHYSFLNGAATAFGTTASFNGLYFSGNVSLTVTQ